jgi:hypothetical protein
MRFVAIAVTLVLSLAASAETISTPAQLIAAMHDRYASKWYHTLSFKQDSITHKPDGSQSTEIWYEALLVPGHLRINIGSPNSGNGMLFVKDHLYIYKDGKLAKDQDYIHPLLVLGFDVYGQPVDTTLQQLKDLKFDLSTLHEETFNGRPAYVVGAKQGDLKTLQFWVDKERLYFVRLLEPSKQDPGQMQDIGFEDYQPAKGGGWVAEHVTVRSDGKLVFEERYSDVKIDPPLAENFFDPKQFIQSSTGEGK